jgi:hypothetical protein
VHIRSEKKKWKISANIYFAEGPTSRMKVLNEEHSFKKEG